MRPSALIAALAAALAVAPTLAQDSTPAKQLFGAVTEPIPMEARSIGSYARGCLGGAQALPIDGPAWQAMRLSRNRNWGHPSLIAYLERLATEVRAQDGWPGLLVGDLSQPRGGPMRTGHASHQIGLDADIWLTPMPDRTLSRQEREEIGARSMLVEGELTVNPGIWTEAHARLIRRAASYPEVARIFVHPGIKQALCQWAGNDTAWLRKVRPWWGHHEHFHIRLQCPPGQAGCGDQDAPPPGDGCGAELAWWFTPEPWAPPDPDRPASPPREIMLADLPQACTAVLGQAVASGAPVDPPLPRPRPN